MHRGSVLIIALTTTVAGAAAARSVHDLAAAGRSSPLERHRAAEVARLRAHFDSVDGELRARDVSSLTTRQRASRARLIAWLRDYRDAGSFPENDRFATPEPFFRDHRGVLCAMAYLIDRAGRGDIVDDVARTRNNAYIRELVDDRRLVAWLDSTGLTAAEAARIQPTYGPPPDGVIGGGKSENKMSDSYKTAAGTLIGASLVSSALSVVAPTRGMGLLATVVGVGAAGLGIDGLSRGSEYHTLGAVTTGAGALAVVIGIRTLRHLPMSGPGPARQPAISVEPALLGPARRDNLGVVIRTHF